MRSSDLASYGFGTWSPFSKAGKPALIASLPVKPGVYAIRCCREFTRKNRSSDILYFVSATNAQALGIEYGSISVQVLPNVQTSASSPLLGIATK
jgi:hypothetical protein